MQQRCLNYAVTSQKKSIKGRSDADAHVRLVLQQTEDSSGHVLEAAVVAAIDGELVVVVVLNDIGDNNTWCVLLTLMNMVDRYLHMLKL